VIISRPLGAQELKKLVTNYGLRRQKQVTVGLPPTQEVIISRPLGAQELKKLITTMGVRRQKQVTVGLPPT
jgi:hypothetical protein